MSIESIIASLSGAIEIACRILSSNFTIAFVGGLTGAVGGALGAQHIVERSQRRKEGLRELRYTNAAIMVAFSICNAAFALKKQHVQPRRESFLKSKADLLAFKAQRDAKQVAADVEFRFQMDMSTYPAPVVPIESLKQMVFQEISVVGRPLALVAVVEQSLIGLTAAIARRDLLIQKFASGEIAERVRTNYYFGFPLPDGHVNQEFPDLVEAIHSYVDNLAFFSSLLCTDLMKHGSKVRDTLLKQSPKQVPNVSTVDFSTPRTAGLMPSDAEYRDWLNAFVESPHE